MHDDEPELAGYEPGDGKPLRPKHLVIAMRVIVVIGLVALVLPGVITTLMVAKDSAAESCRRWVKFEVPDSPGSSAAFEILGAHGTGWQCYTKGAFGGDRYVASLGLIPGAPKLPSLKPAGA